MSGHPLARTAALLIAAATLASVPAQAQWRDGNPTVLISPDGRLIQDIPEAGSVRVVVDQFGRRLVVNDWNEVIGIEVPLREFDDVYREQPRQRDYRNRARLPEFGDRNAFPVAPPPPDVARYPEPDRDGFASIVPPEAQIERRDLNPLTGTIPGADISPDVAPAPDAFPPVADGSSKLTKPQVVALQVFLDRKGMSPGIIDGRMGSNVRKALAAWNEASGEDLDPSDTDAVLERLAGGEGLAFTTYTITAEDAAGPYVASIPSDYSEKAKMERLPFTSTFEMLAERFHMDEAYLRELNPDADFSRPGTRIKVAKPGSDRTEKVASIVADKSKKQVRAYNSNGKLVAAYPATIGSADTPSPSGQVSIERIAHNPGYTYNPKINFKQGSNDKVLEVPPGPNGPVGSIWIALSKPTYGIHGTPEPSKIGKTESHGCVRLTNWDAEELASMVEPGVTVSFKE